MTQFTFYRVYCDKFSTREEVEDFAVLLNLYNLAEMWGVTQMIGVEYEFYTLRRYSLIIKVRTDCIKTFSTGMRTSLEEVSAFGQYTNIAEMIDRLKGKVPYKFFQV